MNEELRAITKNQRSLDSAVVMSSLMPSEKYSCSGSPLILTKGSTAIAGRSGSGKPGRDCSRISSGGEPVTCSGSLPFVCARTTPTKRSPLRAMVRMSFWSPPLSPTAFRAALMRLVRVEYLGIDGNGIGTAAQLAAVDVKHMISKVKLHGRVRRRTDAFEPIIRNISRANQARIKVFPVAPGQAHGRELTKGGRDEPHIRCGTSRACPDPTRPRHGQDPSAGRLVVRRLRHRWHYAADRR